MRRWGLIAIVLLTFACRAAYVVPIRLAQAESPIRGAEVELSALSLLEKGELGNVYHDPTGPTAHVSPLYPLVVAAIFAVLGPNTLAAMLTQSFLAIGAVAASFACLPWLARRIGLSEAAGWIAAFVLAVVPINFYYESYGDWEQPFAAPVLIGLLACFLALRDSAWTRPALVGAAGVLTGIAALLSPSLLPAVALMGLAEFVWPSAPRRRILAGGVGIIAVTAVLVTPWMVRNYYALGGFVPLRSNFGLEISFGNNPTATGSSNVDWSDPDMSEKMRHPHPNTAECARLREMGELAYMKQRQQEAVAWITANPGRFAELTVIRLRLFWFPTRELFNNDSLLTKLKIAGFGSIGLLMFLTLGRMAWMRHPGFIPVAAALVGASFIYLITHVELRYRLPLHALSSLLAADAIVVAFRWVRRLRSSDSLKARPAEQYAANP